MRREKESVHNYVAELRSIAQFCNFGATLDAMLRDRLVCGINHEETQKKLLGESALTYQKALEIAQGLEVAAESLETIKQGESSKPRHDQVNKLHVSGIPSKVSNAQGGRSNMSGDCHRWGTQQLAADVKCHQCGKVWHLKAVCRSKQKVRSLRDTLHGYCHNRSAT